MKKNKDILWYHISVILLVALAVVFFSAKMIGKCYNPFVFNDEAGYWTHASVMAGFDWRGMSNGLAWYSFGYSFMLAPLMKIFHDPVILYRAALVLNVIMQLAVYFMYIRILRFLFPKLGIITSAVISGSAAMYTSYQHNTGLTWSETAALFAAVLITWCLVRVVSRPTVLNLAALGLLCTYSFMVHNRCIGIAASACLVVVLCVLTGKISFKTSLAFWAALVCGFGINYAVKHRLESYLWVSGKSSGNDSGSMVDKIKRGLSSRSELVKMISVFASQFFAAVISTFGIAFPALKGMTVRIIKELTVSVKALKNKEKQNTDEKNLIFLFIFCAFISSWIISAVFMLDYRRIDHVVYTRYFDITVGLLILAGLGFMTEEHSKSDYMMFMAAPLILTCGANRANVLVRNMPGAVFSRVCAPGVCLYYEKFSLDFYKYALVALVLFGILSAVSMIRKRGAGIVMTSVLLAALFTVSADYARQDLLVNQDAYAGDRELVKTASEIPDAEIRADRGTGAFISFLQFMMPDRKLSFLTEKDRQNENVYWFADIKDSINLRDYELVAASDRHALYRCVTSDVQVYELPLSNMMMFDEGQYISETDDIKNSESSNYVCYGPYFRVDEGGYEVVLDMDFENTDIENIGYAEVKSNSLGVVYNHTELTGEMLEKDGSLNTELPVQLDEAVSDIEIVIYIYDPAQISMILNSIRINTED